MHRGDSPFCLLSLALDAGNGSFTDHVAGDSNLRRALKRIVANRGAPGADGVTVGQLQEEWSWRAGELKLQLLEGSYAPAPIRRVAIPKPGGKGVRVLGIPTVLDRVVQQALAQPLVDLLDDGFSPFSFGFRPGRSAHDALLHAGGLVEAGNGWVLHLDLEKFFDRAPHEIVLARLRERVRDTRLCGLVGRFLAAPFSQEGRLIARQQGLPQGGPLSPFLANLLLDELDYRLFDAGYPFFRYADDIGVYFPSRSDAVQARSVITPWIERDLKLRLNREKTRIVRCGDDTILGYRLRMHSDGRINFAPAEVSRDRLLAAVRRLLARQRTGNLRELVNLGLNPLLRGWVNYFGLCDDPEYFAWIDRQVISQLRRWAWFRIRDPRRMAHTLVRRGVPAPTAWSLASARNDPATAIDSQAFRGAYPAHWFRRHGLIACREEVVSPAGSGWVVEPPAPPETTTDARTGIERDCLHAFRGCIPYECAARPDQSELPFPATTNRASADLRRLATTP